MKWGLPERALKSANKRVTEVLSAEKTLKKREEKSRWCIPIKTGHQLGGTQQKMVTLEPLFTLNLNTLNLVKAQFVVLIQLFIYLIMNYITQISIVNR